MPPLSGPTARSVISPVASIASTIATRRARATSSLALPTKRSGGGLVAALTQARALDLAAGGLRKRTGELDDARVLVWRGLGLHVFLQLSRQRFGGSVAIAQHHDRANHLAAHLVGRRHRRRLGYRGVRHEGGLDFERADPVA